MPRPSQRSAVDTGMRRHKIGAGHGAERRRKPCDRQKERQRAKASAAGLPLFLQPLRNLPFLLSLITSQISLPTNSDLTHSFPAVALGPTLQIQLRLSWTGEVRPWQVHWSMTHTCSRRNGSTIVEWRAVFQLWGKL